MRIGFAVAGKQRSKVFTPEFMDQFVELHREYNAGNAHDIKKSYGAPDMGNGRYSERLSYSSIWIYIYIHICIDQEFL